MADSTPDEMLFFGLELVYVSNPGRLTKSTRDRNVPRFKTFYGATPEVHHELWNDLQNTDNLDALVLPEDLNMTSFFVALHFLKCYPLEDEREALFDVSPKSGRGKVWFFVEKIRNLRADKIVWPYEIFEDEEWVMTVDGTHCEFQEPSHPEFSIDTGYFSHKHGQAGLAYEIGISLFDSKVVWLNGPFRAGMNDKSIFTEDGGLNSFIFAMT